MYLWNHMEFTSRIETEAPYYFLYVPFSVTSGGKNRPSALRAPTVIAHSHVSRDMTLWTVSIPFPVVTFFGMLLPYKQKGEMLSLNGEKLWRRNKVL
jgi:hypothetical protein